MAPTIHRSESFDVVIYTRDHPPPHVHVFNSDGECVVTLGNFARGPALREVNGMRDRDVARAFRLVEANQQRYLLNWRQIHGT